MVDKVENVRGKNTKRKHLNKNKKKSWRKVNIDEVEEFLEDERLQERTGGKVAEKKNESLFFVDKKKSKDPKKVIEKGLKRKRKAQDKLKDVEVALQPPPPKKKDKRAPVVLEKIATGKLSKTFRTALKQRKESMQQRKQKAFDKRQLPVADFDLWGDTLESVHAKDDPHYLRVTRKTRISVPRHHSAPVSKLPAVEIPQGGASYNPAFDEHQNLLAKAHIVEDKKIRKEEKILRALDAKFPSKQDAPTEASRLEEMSAGLFDEPEEDNEDVGDLDKLSVNPPVRREDKKDERQRKKEKARKELAKQKEQEKLKRIKDNNFFRLKSIKKEVKAQEKVYEEKADKKAEYKAGELYRTRRLGKMKFEEPDLELKLSDELVGSLRELKPEGHLLEDRFKSLQKRNIIEPRGRAKRTKPKFKPKVFERKTHREVK